MTILKRSGHAFVLIKNHRSPEKDIETAQAAWEENAVCAEWTYLGCYGILRVPKPQLPQGDAAFPEKHLHRRRQGLDGLHIPRAIGFGELPLREHALAVLPLCHRQIHAAVLGVVAQEQGGVALEKGGGAQALEPQEAGLGIAAVLL